MRGRLKERGLPLNEGEARRNRIRKNAIKFKRSERGKRGFGGSLAERKKKIQRWHARNEGTLNAGRNNTWGIFPAAEEKKRKGRRLGLGYLFPVTKRFRS